MEEGMFERGPELRRETVEIKRSPEQVFDSDRSKAERESNELQRMLSRVESLHKRNGGAELHIETSSIEKGPSTHAKSIKIVWCGRYDDEGTMLQLDPITEGRGPEAGVFGYKGRFGKAIRKDDNFVLSPKSKPVTLEQLFGCPEGTDLRVKPTVHRWAVGKDELSAMGGEDTYTLFMGLGFLLMDQKWMYIGFHEAGPLPHQNDENSAWTTGKRNHAKIYKGNRDLQKAISSGKHTGLFGVLEKPFRSRDLTVGKIERYGITSHYLAGNSKLPESWKNEDYSKGITVKEVMDDFDRRIEEAQFSFDEFFE